MEFEIGQEDSKKSVKQFLYNTLRLSHGQVTALKRQERGILLNGERVFVTALLQEGDRLSLLLEDREEHKPLVPFACPLEILYEDETLLCVNKPPFMPTHPSLNHYDDTLANALAEYFRLKNRPFVFRGINRLDRDTSGLTLIARHYVSAGILSGMLARKASGEAPFYREYLCLVRGHVIPEEGTITAPLSRKPGSVIERVVDFENGESAVTHYKVLEEKNGLSLVSLRLETGRTHQIRIHMKYLGFPLIGDYLYNPDMERISRQALHSSRLVFRHPITGEKMEFTAPLPEDIKRAWEHS